MTKLFQEYEIQRLARENPQSLVGKKFCWNDVPEDLFTITRVIHDDYIEYQYENGSTARRYLSKILEKITQITE